jgi:REP element-mobilizing transposase RayT
MSRYIHKSHNVTVLLYHLVFPAKYRRAVIDATIDQVLREVCLEIETRYQLNSWRSGRNWSRGVTRSTTRHGAAVRE